jgi:hypothetical protein
LKNKSPQILCAVKKPPFRVAFFVAVSSRRLKAATKSGDQKRGSKAGIKSRDKSGDQKSDYAFY